jgi:predicted transcriptional regulator
MQSSILEDTKKDLILEIMSDKYSRIIIEATRDKPKTAQEISMEFKIPISTVYRRLQSLHDAKTLEISGSISSDGKKFFMYRSKISEISAKFDGSEMQITVTSN